MTVIPLALAVATLAATAVLVQYLALRWQPINLVDELAVADLQVVLSAAPPEQMPVLASWIAEFGLHMQPDSTADAAGDRAVRLSDGRRVALSTVVSWLDSGKRIDPVTQRALGPVPSAWQAALPAPSDTSTINSVAAEAALPEMEEGRWKTLLLPLSSGRFVAISSPDFSLSAQHVASAGAVVFAIAFVGTGIVVVLFFWTFRGRFAARSAERLSAPLERLAEAVRNATRTARFTSPVSVNDKSPRELVELARDFNALQAMVSEALADRETVIGHQRRLVAELAHELRTPLTVILGHAEVLSRTAASAKAADVIQRQARDLHLLVSDLLDAAQVESIEATLEADKVDLVSLAQEMIQRFSMPGRRHGVSVCLESAPSSGDALVTADARWLRQVVANVVT
ncbi:MAG TPA: HAMP domain-containing sensor histidine kinase, partial [Rubrivivax sp.]|nr:HAMP domain-containing sensor histidine kinase [Rubrivivax sp.]